MSNLENIKTHLEPPLNYLFPSTLRPTIKARKTQGNQLGQGLCGPGVGQAKGWRRCWDHRVHHWEAWRGEQRKTERQQWKFASWNTGTKRHPLSSSSCNNSSPLSNRLAVAGLPVALGLVTAPPSGSQTLSRITSTSSVLLLKTRLAPRSLLMLQSLSSANQDSVSDLFILY